MFVILVNISTGDTLYKVEFNSEIIIEFAVKFCWAGYVMFMFEYTPSMFVKMKLLLEGNT
jgi:hypothetical protein